MSEPEDNLTDPPLDEIEEELVLEELLRWINLLKDIDVKDELLQALNSPEFLGEPNE